jgi:sugar lactone lactonase YvrE
MILDPVAAQDEVAAAGKMYWTHPGANKIQRANLDGTQVQDLVSGLLAPDWIALDAVGGRMYWTEEGTGKIQRANPDGTDVQDVVVGLHSPTGVALDLTGGHLYWATEGSGKIQRADLDGTDVQDLVTGLGHPVSIALDVAGGRMYWTDAQTGMVQRANLDGTGVQDVVVALRFPAGIALDVDEGRMYWADQGTGKIQRANLDGTDLADLITGLSDPVGIALDVAGGKIYWTEWVSFLGSVSKVRRANLDGTGTEDLVTGLSFPIGIALDMGRELSALGSAKLWAGLKNSDAVGLRLDLKVEVFVNNTIDLPIGSGQVNNTASGSSGFGTAVLSTIPLELIDGPVTLTAGDQLLLRVSVRRTCFGGGHNSGTVRLWFNGKAIDSGTTPDAGSRFDATIEGSRQDYFLRTGLGLSPAAGAARTSIDAFVNSAEACPNRSFTSFGTWSTGP